MSQNLVAESVVMLIDAEARLSRAETRLRNFNLLYETISQFLDFKDLEKDLEYSGLDFAMQWLKNHAPEVDTE